MEPDTAGAGQPFTPVTIEQLRSSLFLFAKERQWEIFHTPRNVLLALVGEVCLLAGGTAQACYSTAAAAGYSMYVCAFLALSAGCTAAAAVCCM